MTAVLASESAPVERADVFVLSAPLDPPAGVSIGYATAHEYVLVRLTDSDGCCGWGESYLMPGLEHTVAEFARLILGRPAGAVREHARVLTSTRSSAYGRSAVMIALDDLRARQLGVPIHRLYGGGSRSSVLAYAASQGYVQGVDFESTWREETARYLDEGYRAIKLRTGRFAVDREAAALSELRATIGDSVEFMVDGNGGYSLGEALRMGSVLAELDARWFEEPLPQDGYPGYPELRQRLEVPLAGGEILENARDASRILAAGAVDILQPDVVICGGIGAALEVADLSNVYGIPVIPHTSGGAIGIAATLQLLAALPDLNRSPGSGEVLLEFGQGPNPWRTDVLTEPFALRNGRLDIPSGAGLGVEVDATLVADRAVFHAEVTQP